MWLTITIWAARLSLRQLSVGIWIIFLFGLLIGWLYRWIMDDSR